ncbi:MAG: potassium transporter [Spirochaetes bacterium GWF1_31_7]|nr:MAG: potassium transporter [Spirochaetes bacterium GWE1_32_154]OHD45662.1 MAG: potassium transporter [Spirochaetes bacterium GWE2_31_10]OHD48233.1 MAG: potassium transporter [Spirochaetes bacterium GWF1_31_7]OHD81927.1 MAG: potassium transporter [Spirochaetes bacterium RIFOXYB1_FULL_32_8]HBD95776.1 potassium transporter [Spirochaetia bacterium]
MLVSLSILIIASLLAGILFRKLGLPELLGMIFVGIILGPYGFDYVDKQILLLSKELRTLALIIILIRAGLGINRDLLNKVGFNSFKMSFIPCIFEGVSIMIISHYVLYFDIVTSGILGFIIAAVSPAVVVPQMIALNEYGFGKNKEIPTLILAGASIDDVFAITIFTVFLNIKTGKNVNILQSIIGIPVSIIFGIGIGLILGMALVLLFRKFHIRDTKKVLLFIVVAILFNTLEQFFTIATLLGIMTIGFVILEKSSEQAKRMASKFGKIWVFAEIVLFTLIGMEVNYKMAFSSQYTVLIIAVIIFGLVFRSLGVFTALLFSSLNMKERLFCAISYIPKATVQAAIGAIPLSMGVAHGELILSVAVMSIIITAPVGTVLIKITAPKLLVKN